MLVALLCSIYHEATMSEIRFTPVFVTEEWLLEVAGKRITDLTKDQLINLEIIRLGQLELATLPGSLEREHCSSPEEASLEAIFRGLEEIDRVENNLLTNIEKAQGAPAELEEDWKELGKLRAYRRRQYALLRMRIDFLELSSQSET